jgi:hypothetical protein
MGLAWSSVAALAMAPLQDLVNLGRESRMNIPGRPEGNWCWRCTEDALSDPAFEWLRDLTKNSNRSGALLSPHTGRCWRPYHGPNAIVLLSDGLEHCLRSRNLG